MAVVDITSFSIYDTNIIIYAIIGEITEKILEIKNKMNIADKVKDEIKNKLGKSEYYREYKSLVYNERINIISERRFSEEQKRGIVANLMQFKMQNFFGRPAYLKNEGEFASALYAINLNIPTFYTNDLAFIREYGKEEAFKTLSILTFKELLAELYDEEKIDNLYEEIMERADNLSEHLNEEREEYEIVKRKELMNDFSKKFNLPMELIKSLPEV